VRRRLDLELVFIGQAGPDEFLGWDTAAGDYEITALDDHGRAGSCNVIVR